MVSRLQKRWSPRLRTAGALFLLAGTVALADRLLPRAPDPLTGTHRPLIFLVAAAILIPCGALMFWLGRRWR